MHAIKTRLAAIRTKGNAHTQQEYLLSEKGIGAINVAFAKLRWRGVQDEQGISDLVVAAASAISGLR